MIVVDASVALKWLVAEDDSDRASALLGREIVAPDLIAIECANALWKKTRKREIDLPQALAGLAGVELFVRVVPSRPFAVRALELGAQLGHPVYDCFYLALAERLNAVLLTADVRFHAKVRQAVQAARVELLAEFG